MGTSPKGVAQSAVTLWDALGSFRDQECGVDMGWEGMEMKVPEADAGADPPGNQA